ncbi:MAG: GNAT family N-acetyltransferase, partial [Clostridiales bacterium]|nr:GNAT family N-acetyltransferase [Clostridiales bacterium]
MTNKELLAVAMQQSALDLNCAPEDFFREESVVVHSCAHPQARRYLELPFYCNLVSYGNHIVASVNPEIEPAVRDYIRRFAAEHCFETPNLHVLNDALQRHGHRLCFMAEYFLPDLTALEERPCAYEVELWGPERFGGLYLPQWSNALCEKRRELDVLAAAALDRGRLVGLAGCSADCGAMWQIGIDVLPEYRRQGIASALTSRLALEILRRGKVPFYCAA